VLYALLLQAFVAAAAPGARADTFAGTSCAQTGSGPRTPGDEQHRHHSDCCILACAACGCATVAAAPGVAVFPLRNTSTVIWNLTSRLATFPSFRRNFSARGPPAA
jgi:hypothetical protein